MTFIIDAMRRISLMVLVTVFSLSVAMAQRGATKSSRKTVYEEVDLEDVMKRYFEKSFTYPIEGIYSVSCVITRRGRKFLSHAEKVRVVSRHDNYAKVAIMKDWPTSTRDFIEVSLSYRRANAFPIMGELDIMADGRGYVYTHIEPDGERMTFSMLESDGLLEAEFSKVIRKKTITYRLSYLKIYPVLRADPALSEFR